MDQLYIKNCPIEIIPNMEGLKELSVDNCNLLHSIYNIVGLEILYY